MISKEQDFLKIEKLNFSYGKYPILKDITCNIQERKMTAIIGPNGCGKSTLLKNILGFHSGNFESFSLLGKNWKEFSPKDLARVIAYIPQKINIIPGISVRDFVMPKMILLNKGREEGEIEQANPNSFVKIVTDIPLSEMDMLRKKL